MTNKERKAIATALSEEGWVVTQMEVNHVLDELKAAGTDAENDEDANLDSLVDDAVNSVYSRSGDHNTCNIYRAGLKDAIELARDGRLAFSPDEEYWFDTQENANG